MTKPILQTLLTAALLAASAVAFAGSIEVSVTAGQQEARFSLGASNCVLVDEVIRCAPALAASN